MVTQSSEALVNSQERARTLELEVIRLQEMIIALEAELCSLQGSVQGVVVNVLGPCSADSLLVANLEAMRGRWKGL